MILALCAWTFFACGNGKKNETSATEATQPAKPRFDNPYFAQWVADGEANSLEMIAGGQTYAIQNLQVYTSETFTFEAASLNDSTEVWILQGHLEAGTVSSLEFNGARLGGTEEKRAEGWYLLYSRDGRVNLGEKANLSVVFRRKP